uniref:Uncharacterized protein n=1 Tax=Rhizobium phage IG49 TaxID=3129228 RepID=A0AAU8HZM6_9CAUD
MYVSQSQVTISADYVEDYDPLRGQKSWPRVGFT